MTERQKVIAFALGYLFKSNRLSFGVDDASKWITVHPNGKGPKKSGDGDKKGRRILIDEETGFIFGGMGSENGKTIKQVVQNNKNRKEVKQASKRPGATTLGWSGNQVTSQPATQTQEPTQETEEQKQERLLSGPSSDPQAREARAKAGKSILDDLNYDSDWVYDEQAKSYVNNKDKIQVLNKNRIRIFIDDPNAENTKALLNRFGVVNADKKERVQILYKKIWDNSIEKMDKSQIGKLPNQQEKEQLTAEVRANPAYEKFFNQYKGGDKTSSTIDAKQNLAEAMGGMDAPSREAYLNLLNKLNYSEFKGNSVGGRFASGWSDAGGIELNSDISKYYNVNEVMIHELSHALDASDGSGLSYKHKIADGLKADMDNLVKKYYRVTAPKNAKEIIAKYKSENKEYKQGELFSRLFPNVDPKKDLDLPDSSIEYYEKYEWLQNFNTRRFNTLVAKRFNYPFVSEKLGTTIIGSNPEVHRLLLEMADKGAVNARYLPSIKKKLNGHGSTYYKNRKNGGIDSELFAETSAIRNRDYETYSKLKEIFPEYIKRYEAAYSEALDWSRQPN